MFPKKNIKISHGGEGDTCNSYRQEEHKVLAKIIKKKNPLENINTI